MAILSKNQIGKKIFLATTAIIVLASSAINLWDNRHRISHFMLGGSEEYSEYYHNQLDTLWANEILKGGYILHFRHAEREKWIDVTMYDALESDLHNRGVDESRYAEDDYFSKAVCLNSRGKIQARAMGEHLKNINLPIGPVVSSVSCRARQTAELAFDGYDTLHRLLVHTGPYNERRSDRLAELIDFYNDLPLEPNKNTIVSAHNSVVLCQMFENCKDKSLKLEEGGFFVISKREDGLHLEHEFHNYNDFNRVFYLR